MTSISHLTMQMHSRVCSKAQNCEVPLNWISTEAYESSVHVYSDERKTDKVKMDCKSSQLIVPLLLPPQSTYEYVKARRNSSPPLTIFAQNKNKTQTCWEKWTKTSLRSLKDRSERKFTIIGWKCCTQDDDDDRRGEKTLNKNSRRVVACWRRWRNEKKIKLIESNQNLFVLRIQHWTMLHFLSSTLLFFYFTTRAVCCLT